jgi:conjugal transfer pilus assembly protein TraU
VRVKERQTIRSAVKGEREDGRQDAIEIKDSRGQSMNIKLARPTPKPVERAKQMKLKLKLLSLPIAILLTLPLLFPTPAKALCAADDFLGISMITKMCYECILPIHIFGVEILPGVMPSRRDSISPFYICSVIPPSFGFPVGFYEPALAIEVVTDPMCFPALGGGNSASGSQTGLFMAGSKADDNTAELTFYQSHMITTPILEILGLLKSICPKAKAADFDLLSLSELYPQWQDDALSAIIYPEALLFAAPPLQLACAADAVAANVYTPLDSLFWCKGSWGGTYPLSGTTQSKSLIEDTASIGANAIAFSHRNNTLKRTWGGDAYPLMCLGSAPHPVWDKSAYRMQLMGPIPHPLASQIGEAGIVKQWTALKWRPNAGDNFTYLLFRKTDCLVGL